MNRLTASGIALVAALALGACGGGGGSGGSGSGGPSDGATATTVAVRQLAGVGAVLVDHSGKALYSSDLEAGGRIVCDDAACKTFWKPLTVTGGAPTASGDAGSLGVIRRPDGSRQVTVAGRPLYTFAEDGPGKATGDGFTDDFDGHHFTWNVIHPGGQPSSSSGAAGGGYGY
jgi:predicted lipoprotein with Yx(FWY)xxD motif